MIFHRDLAIRTLRWNKCYRSNTKEDKLSTPPKGGHRFTFFDGQMAKSEPYTKYNRSAQGESI